MADFVDDEASEVSDEHISEDDDVGPSRKDKRRGTKRSREVVDSSDEEEEEDDNDEVMDDLINDDEEEEESSDNDEDDGGGKSSDGSSSLTDDDLDLIQENSGIRIDRKKKFRRIRKVDNDDSDEEADEGKQIQAELFGPSDLLESDDEEVQKQKTKPSEPDLAIADDESESESDDNFIVDDNDQPIARKSKKKGARYNDSAMQQAQEIFGVDFDFEDVDGEDDYDEGGYQEDYDEETGDVVPRRKRDGRKTIYDVYEPAELERSHITAQDQAIKAKDEPERFQLRSVPVTEADDEEISQESDWIFTNAFDQQTITLQERDREPIAGKRSMLIKPEIAYALKCIRNEKLEVSFIAAYRREYVTQLASSFDDTRDLWTIYRFDEQWCKLQKSKNSICNLYRDMRAYLDTKGDDSNIRKISDSELQRIQEAKTFHDIEDCRLHFKLYYSELITEMKLYTLEKKIEEQKLARANKPKKTRRNHVEGDNDEERTDDGGDGLNDEEEQEDEEEEEEDKDQETEEEKLYKRLSKFKISSSKDRYHLARQHQIGDLVKKFGLTPEEFGENLRDDYQRNTVAQHYTRPLDEAANHVKPGTRFANREDVLDAAKLMYCREISCDPLVRQNIRKYYFDNAVINVKPTTLGLKEIDENHPCYSFKFLRNKPVARLTGDQFLNMVNAEKDKLLEVKFSIEPIVDTIGQISPYHESLKALFYSDFSSIITKEWNELRDEAIKTATDKFILPCLEKQLRDKLVKEAQDKIMKDSCSKLHNWLNVAPYAPTANFDNYEDFELRNGTRICGFTFEPDGEAPCFAAIIDSEGELVDHVRLPFLNIRKRPDRMNAVERENHTKDRVKFKQFIINKKPHVVALVAETIQTKYICQHLAQILDELREHDNLPLIPIEIVDNELSNIYMNLKKASEEFPEFPPLLLQAISTARKLNDPLSEYAKLCTPDHDILCIRFHSLQDELPKEEFLDQLYQCFVTRTNAVGVDPNRTISHPHTTNLIQFVAGLGPRKGSHLLRLIKKSKKGLLVSRQQLVVELGMTAVIFINCAGFIKLDTDSMIEDYPEDHITPLDSTRIHPQSYGLAKKIAVDAVNENEEDEGASDEAAANAIETILDHPERLDELDLNAFATELDEVQKLGKKAFTLQSIREELHCRYRDHRKSYQQPSQEEIFAMLTKETPQTFYIGKLITCKVVQIPRRKPGSAQLDMANPVKEKTNLWRCPFCNRNDFQDLSVVWNHFDTDDCPGYAIGVKCVLDNGLFGFVPTKFLSDKEIADPSERVAIGQLVHARVIKIDPEKFSCDLTCRTSELIDEAGKLKPPKNEDYDYEAERRAKDELEAKSKRNARRPYCKRVIVHPSFENIDCKTCEKKLSEMEQGHAIIRPSSQGQNYLTLSWKVAEDIYQHVTIREEGKDNAFSLGHQLFIENEPYEDLDEIIARYIQPMASYARELLNYKYCIKLQSALKETDVMQEELFMAKRAQPCFPYRFCPSRDYPGKFLLGYMPKDKPKIEYLTVTARGYRFRKLNFKNLASLIKWFKENWNWTANLMSIQNSVPMSQ